jgi:xanthine dehydrogenase YagR molybdenum-binding subunit
LKLTGRATYAYEHKIPKALRGVMVTSTIAKGRIASIDVTAAEGSLGVAAVMTHLNARKLPCFAEPTKAPPTGRLVQVLHDGSAARQTVIA